VIQECTLQRKTADETGGGNWFEPDAGASCNQCRETLAKRAMPDQGITGADLFDNGGILDRRSSIMSASAIRHRLTIANR
jgi:hypothetical protein